MTDTPSSILLTREQSTGSNTNLWGGYLITTQRQTEQASKGWQTLAVTGDATISWTNYTTGNVGQCAHLVLTGTLASAAVLTFPNNQNKLTVHNNAGATVTIMCSAGIGVAIPNARKADIYCNGSDYFSDTPTWTGDTTTLTNPGDLVSNLQMATAIANAALPATAGTVLNSISDTAAGYLSSKVTGSGAVAITTTSPGGNEKLNISVGAIGLTLQASQTISFSASAGNLYPVDCTAGNITVTLPAATGTFGFIGLAKFGTGLMILSGTVNGSSAGITILDEGLLPPIMDSGASRGWV